MGEREAYERAVDGTRDAPPDKDSLRYEAVSEYAGPGGLRYADSGGCEKPAS